MFDTPLHDFWKTELDRFCMDSMAMPIGVFSDKGKILWTNRGMQTLLGMNEGTHDPLLWLINPTFDQLLALGPEGKIFDGLLTAGDGAATYRSVKARVFRKGNQMLIVSEYDALQLDSMNREMSQLNQQISNLQRDLIKEKHALQRALNELSVSESKYRRLFEGAILGIFQSTQDGRLLRANPAFAEIFGYESTEELMDSVADLASDLYDKPDRFDENARLAIEHNEAVRVEERFRRKNGRSFLANLRKWAVRDKNDRLLYLEGFIEDIEEQKRMEAAMTEARKMEAIAVLAGGIAHEFNNALMGLVGYIDLLQLELPQEATAVGYCDAMHTCSQRMVKLSRQLLAYAKGGKYQPRTQPLSGIVKAAVAEARSKCATEIRWTVDCDKQDPHVSVDATQMKMVVGILLENAVEALEAGTDEAAIDIRTVRAKLIQSAPDLHPGMKPGIYLRLEVQDNGAGMEDGVRERIFEPFYTTKFHGRGLGMAAAYGIVKNHSGWIFVEPAQPSGTTVRIFLPAATS